MTDLARVLLGAPDQKSVEPNAQLRYGTVTQVSPLLVKVGAASTGQPCNRVASYSPSLNDYVAVLVQGAERIVVDSLAPTPWIAVSFTNSWTNYGTGYELARYRKIGDNVQLQGLITGGTIGLGAFTLPVGYRPPLIVTVATSSNGAFGAMAVDTGGVAIPVIGSPTNFAVNSWFSTLA